MKKKLTLMFFGLAFLIGSCQNKMEVQVNNDKKNSYEESQPLPNPEAYFSAIIVNNIDSSILWYSNNFGFKVITKVESKEKGFKQANLKCGNILIELIELESSLSPNNLLKNHPEKTKIDGFFKLGFLVSEFEKWAEHLKKSEVEFYGGVVVDNLTGKKMLIVKDPDGNRIQIFEKEKL